MLTLDATQQAIVASTVKDRVAWLFEVTAGGSTSYWSTQEIVWGGHTYSFAVLPDSFRGVSLSRGRSELGIQSPSDMTFSVSNPDHLLDAGDFIDGQVILRLLIKAGANEAVIRSWKFTITDALSLYGQIDVTAVDFLAAVLDGDYPNTRSVKDIFATSDVAPDDNVCVPLPFGTAYVPLRSVYVGDAVGLSAATISAAASVDSGRCRLIDAASGFGEIEPGRWLTVSGFADPANNGSFVVLARPDNGTIELSKDAGLADEAAGSAVTLTTGSRYYVLGDPARTYTINRVRSPRDCGLKSEWTAAEGFSFPQKTVTDALSQSWKGMQPIIACSETSLTTPDAPGFWRNGDLFLDMPVMFSRDDTAALTNPADVLEFVFEDMGIAAGDVDATAQATAKALFASRGVIWNGALWYKQTREKVVACLLNMCHATLRVTDKLSVRPISRVSVRTITKADIAAPRSFTARRSTTRKNADCAHVLWQPAGEAQDRFLQLLVPVKTLRSKIADDALELPFVQDSQVAQRLGGLHFQPLLSKAGEVSFPGKATLLALEPDDVITIDAAEYGGTYPVLIDSLDIDRTGAVTVTGLRFSIELDDWDDLNPSAVTVYSEDTSVLWQPAVSGPLTEKAVGTASYDAWGKESLVVAPEPNRGRYTNLQDALNALAAVNGGSILLKNGTYSHAAPVHLPDCPIEITGESRDGVILRNASGLSLFSLSGLSRSIEIANLTVESVNTSSYATLIYCASALATLSLVLDSLTFLLADNGSVAGDTAVRFESGASSSLTLKNCLSTGGAGFFNQQSAHPGSVTLADNRITGVRYRAILCYAALTRIVRNELSDLYGSGIQAGGAGCVEVIASGNVLNWLTDCPSFGSLRVALALSGSGVSIQDNTVLFASTAAGSNLWGVGIESATGAKCAGNTVSIATSAAEPVGLYLGSGAYDGVVSKNVLRIADASPTYTKRGVYLANGAARNVLNGNNIDMAHTGTSGDDVGIDIMTGCQDNRGQDNIISRFSEDVRSWPADNNLINLVYALSDIDGGEF